MVAGGSQYPHIQVFGCVPYLSLRTVPPLGLHSISPSSCTQKACKTLHSTKPKWLSQATPLPVPPLWTSKLSMGGTAMVCACLASTR